MFGWEWFALAAFLAVIGLIAFKIAHVTHRSDREADNRAIPDAALVGGPEMVEIVGEALAKVATARGQAPKWRRFEPSVLPWKGTKPRKDVLRKQENQSLESEAAQEEPR